MGLAQAIGYEAIKMNFLVLYRAAVVLLEEERHVASSGSGSRID